MGGGAPARRGNDQTQGGRRRKNQDVLFLPFPDEMVSAMKEFEKSWHRPDEKSSSAMPKEIAGAVNMIVHPMAGFAAASAIGFGLAGQAIGIWMGTVAGALDAARRIGLPGGPTKPSDASVRARAATETLIAGARSLAREIADTKEAPAPKRARPAARRRAAVAEPVDARSAGIGRPAAFDDLKAISGIGPKLEHVLNGEGIWTYAQIAAWTPADAMRMDERFGLSGRIGRDDWIGQARRLAGAKGE